MRLLVGAHHSSRAGNSESKMNKRKKWCIFKVYGASDHCARCQALGGGAVSWVEGVTTRVSGNGLPNTAQHEQCTHFYSFASITCVCTHTTALSQDGQLNEWERQWERD
eukprot:COSAG06_NODE_2821_length_6233_cov_6.865015_2_plen_109_part_00